MSTKKWSPGVAIAQVPLKDLKETFFVRVALDEKHVIYLAQIIESGVELPPIVAVKGTNEIVFGRHRKAAYQRLGRISALVEFPNVQDRCGHDSRSVC